MFGNDAMIAAFLYQPTDGVTSVASLPEATSITTFTATVARDVTKGNTELAAVATMTTKVQQD